MLNKWKQLRGKAALVASTSAIALFAVAGGAFAAIAQDEAPTVRETIVVTALKREQDIQDVSLAMNAFTGEQLADLGLTDVTQVALQSPNVNIKYAWGNSMPIYTIRGVGMNSFQASDTPSVGLFIDDVFQTSLVTMGAQLFDVDRVEVLRGPQGALFGRNTNGGAVSYYSRKPGDEFEAQARFDYASYDRFEVEGAVGGPISETVSARLSGMTIQQGEGWVFDRTSGKDLGEVDISALRGQVLFEPSADLSVLLKVFGSRDRSQPQVFQHIGFWQPGAGPATPSADRYCQAFADGRLNAGDGGTDPANCFDVLGYSDVDGDPFAGEYTDRLDTPINSNAELENDIFGGVVSVEKDFGFATLTSISGYQTADRFQPKESDGNPLLFLDLVFASEVEALSQEFRLTSNSTGPFNWIVGATYGKDEVSENPPRVIFADDYLGLRARVVYSQDREAYSVFAQGDVDLSEKLKMSVGLRQIHEDITFTSDVRFLFPPDFELPGLLLSTCPAPAVGLSCTLESNDYAGRIALEFMPTDAMLLYASYSRGFKGGGFNGGLVTNNRLYRPFDPEIILATELGVKSEWFDGRMIVNAAIFDYDYEGLQAATPRPDPVTGTPLNFLTNLTGASVQGAELEVQFRPTEALFANFGVGYLDTSNDDPGVNFGGVFGTAERILPNSPELSFNAAVGYDMQIGSDLNLRLFTDFTWEDEHYKEIVNNLLVPSQSLWNARATLSHDAGGWSVSVYGKNLTDEVYVVDTLTDPAISGWGALVYGAPRTFGVSVNKDW